MSIRRLLAEDTQVIPYRKSLRAIAGSVTATILLQQVIYYDDQKNGEAFYKFKQPCKNKLYKEGDSWLEVLGFSAAEFDNALKKIGTKITKGTSKFEAFEKTDPTGLVIYWTDANRITWYQLNRDLLGKLTKSIYLEDQQSAFTYKTKKVDLHDTKRQQERHKDLTQEGKNELNDLAESVADVCCLDIKTASKSKREQIKTVTLALHHKGVTTADLTDFKKWWLAHDWRGKKGQHPTPTQVGDEWGAFEAYRANPQPNGAPPADNYRGSNPDHQYQHNMTPEQWQAYQKLKAVHLGGND